MSTNAQSELKARLIITGERIDVDQITSVLGVVPTKSWHMGDAVHTRATNRHKQNGWMLVEASSADAVSAEPLLDNLMRKVPIAAVQKLCNQFPGELEVELSIIVYVADAAPAITLEPRHIQYLKEIGASVDFDLYRM